MGIADSACDYEPSGQQVVLVIDDDFTNLALLSAILEESGYLILAEETGQGGLARARASCPDLILLDVLLPDGDGFQLCRSLCGDESTRNIPVIFMTSLAEADFKLKGFGSGAVDYVTKPFNRDEILARVGVHLRIRSLSKGLREANELLGQRVAERTEELARVNERLRGELAVRRRAEEELRFSLAEKEILLKEVHHRVKNNLQILTSLVGMSLLRIVDPDLRLLYQDFANRVRAMAEVHEQVYDTSGFARIDLTAYIRRLAAGLYQAYRDCFGEVEFRMEAEVVEVSLDQAIPCGLLANEVLANAFRHAFPKESRAKGRITVGLRSLEDGGIELAMADDGAGLGGVSEAQAKSGLVLIDLLVGQLNGRKELRLGGGTAWLFRFASGLG
jgi:two-component sensor histidine kinase/ActR/RegA family two-component response regulator